MVLSARLLCTLGMGLEIHVGETKADVSALLRPFLEGLSSECIAERGKFVVAVSGGSMVGLLASALEGVDTSEFLFVFADERFVPPESEDSTFGGYQRGFFVAEDSTQGAVLAIAHEMELEAAAEDYETRLREALGAAGPEEIPQLDLVLLGMGPDGHTASLFPGHALLREDKALIAPISDSPKPPAERLTMTLPLLNAAREVAFVITGEAKAPVVAHVVESAGKDAEEEPVYPAEYVRPSSGHLSFFLDTGAARDLPSQS